MLPMVAKKSEMSAKSAIAVFAGFLAGQKSEMSAIAVFAGFVAGQHLEMSAIAVFAGMLVWKPKQCMCGSHINADMPTYAAHGCHEVGNAGKVGNSGVCWVLGGPEVGNVGNSGVCRHPGEVGSRS